MKYLKFFLLIFILNSCTNKEPEVTTYYLIRHAEKDRTDKNNKNPNLTEKGKQRATNWAKTFKNIDFDFVYSTNYNRTIQTATPTATTKNLDIIFYNPKEMFDTDFQKKTKGKTVLVVGHSNSTPQFVNKILDDNKYEQISDDNNANLYITTITNGVKNSTLLKID
ncbi:phosphoglycerate mutase [Tenacibaculum holothuriorum]|uniref:Phosphoglycerate mutase n=1 Tax=Tenacibaculum holothuriorum TaxID=1635173 RepID=A0A1Y2PFG0_9FLAO|nr:histidine phosphatase family protein [Tenacibaculum holothuriorum]OSY89212.1 phosphoglycerate mutase [Tenacibaculum holothuriorum]